MGSPMDSSTSHRPRPVAVVERVATTRDEMIGLAQRSWQPRSAAETPDSSKRSFEQRLVESSRRMERRLEQMRRWESFGELNESIVRQAPRSVVAQRGSSARCLEQRLLDSFQQMERRRTTSVEGWCAGWENCGLPSQGPTTSMAAAGAAATPGFTWSSTSESTTASSYYDDFLRTATPKTYSASSSTMLDSICDSEPLYDTYDDDELAPYSAVVDSDAEEMVAGGAGDIEGSDHALGLLSTAAAMSTIMVPSNTSSCSPTTCSMECSSGGVDVADVEVLDITEELLDDSTHAVVLPMPTFVVPYGVHTGMPTKCSILGPLIGTVSGDVSATSLLRMDTCKDVPAAGVALVIFPCQLPADMELGLPAPAKYSMNCFGYATVFVLLEGINIGTPVSANVIGIALNFSPTMFLYDVVVPWENLVKWSKWQPWPPPTSVYIICSNTDMRPAPWPSFDMTTGCPGSEWFYWIWKPPWLLLNFCHGPSFNSALCQEAIYSTSISFLEAVMQNNILWHGDCSKLRMSEEASLLLCLSGGAQIQLALMKNLLSSSIWWHDIHTVGCWKKIAYEYESVVIVDLGNNLFLTVKCSSNKRRFACSSSQECDVAKFLNQFVELLETTVVYTFLTTFGVVLSAAVQDNLNSNITRKLLAGWLADVIQCLKLFPMPVQIVVTVKNNADGATEDKCLISCYSLYSAAYRDDLLDKEFDGILTAVCMIWYPGGVHLVIVAAHLAGHGTLMIISVVQHFTDIWLWVLITDHHLLWDSSKNVILLVFLLHRLGGKPILKQGGMSGIGPCSNRSSNPNTWPRTSQLYIIRKATSSRGESTNLSIIIVNLYEVHRPFSAVTAAFFFLSKLSCSSSLPASIPSLLLILAGNPVGVVKVSTTGVAGTLPACSAKLKSQGSRARS